MARAALSLNLGKFAPFGADRVGQLVPAIEARVCLMVAVQTAGLLVLIRATRTVDAISNVYGIVVPLTLALVMARARHAASDAGSVRLLQWIGAISGAYALVHYPLMPIVLPGLKVMATFGAVIVLWVAAVASGLLCLRWPSLALVSASYLVWSRNAAIRVTGLWHGHIIDVVPLAEVALCLVAGLAVARVAAVLGTAPVLGADARTDLRSAALLFSKVLIAAAISIHLGNYYSSFVAKVTLDAGPLSWLLDNDPGKLFRVGLDNNHILYARWPWLVTGMTWLLAHGGAVTNALILFGQGAALVGILMPRRWLLILLLGFDAMHLSIVVLMGANFAPWILLNLAIAAVVVSRHYERPPLLVGLFSMAFILAGDSFMSQARLGWYDTAANNKMYFEAIDRTGGRHYVPSNFFTFYSYPFAHMAYGSPDAAHAFALDNPNGGTQVYRKVVASLSCDVPVLTEADGEDEDVPKTELDGRALDGYVRGYHALARAVTERIGFFPSALYPHHFFVPLGYATDFDSVSPKDIVAYVYRRESVCFGERDGVPVRRVISEAEHRIDLTP